ncbi:hypothetical protein E4T56_gene1425 [Termitomyces sp. T112]|nr:hypothetical protein E4T56_gene1425 [Termitomyces sp. T112]
MSAISSTYTPTRTLDVYGQPMPETHYDFHTLTQQLSPQTSSPLNSNHIISTPPSPAPPTPSSPPLPVPPPTKANYDISNPVSNQLWQQINLLLDDFSGTSPTSSPQQ